MSGGSVLVTGSSGGIGSAVVETARADGYAPIGVDLAPPEQPEALVRFVEGDVTAPEGVAATAHAAAETGDLWGFVHCAGEYPMVSFEDYSTDLWDRVHAVNVRAAFELAKELAPSIQSGGRIVFIASGAGHVGSRDVAYSASKAGLLGLTRSLAESLGPQGIRVNAVSPGVIETQMSGRMPPERRQRHLDRAALGIPGQPEDVAAAVGYLLGPGGRYVTGASIDVNGGLYSR